MALLCFRCSVWPRMVLEDDAAKDHTLAEWEMRTSNSYMGSDAMMPVSQVVAQPSKHQTTHTCPPQPNVRAFIIALLPPSTPFCCRAPLAIPFYRMRNILSLGTIPAAIVYIRASVYSPPPSFVAGASYKRTTNGTDTFMAVQWQFNVSVAKSERKLFLSSTP